jgi:hypothetical protein
VREGRVDALSSAGVLTIFVDRKLTYHSSVGCPEYPEPREAWVAWPHYQRPI